MDTCGDYEIGDAGIAGLKLVEFYFYGNDKITKKLAI